METIKWVSTPKCSQCNPTKQMLKRRSCQGCIKYMIETKEAMQDGIQKTREDAR